jgi:hypothetical protein
MGKIIIAFRNVKFIALKFTVIFIFTNPTKEVTLQL